jgi:hypothetical protein
MKKLLPEMSLNMIITTVACFVLLLVLPVKLTILLVIVYALANTLGLLRMNFPDLWLDGEDSGMRNKPHATFLTVPVSIEGKWYIFCYVNRVVNDGKSTYTLQK